MEGLLLLFETHSHFSSSPVLETWLRSQGKKALLMTLFLYVGNTLPFWLWHNKQIPSKWNRSTNIKIYINKVDCMQRDTHTHTPTSTLVQLNKKQSWEGKKPTTTKNNNNTNNFRNKSFNSRVLITFCLSPLQHIDKILHAPDTSVNSKPKKRVSSHRQMFSLLPQLMNQLFGKLSCSPHTHTHTRF